MPRLIFKRLGGRHRYHHASATRLGPGVLTSEHTHDFVESFLVVRGGGQELRGGGKRRELARGTLVWVEAAERHYYRAGKEGLEFINLAIEAGWWAGFSRLAGVGRRPARRERKLDETGTTALEREWRALLANGSEPGRLARAAGALLTELAQEDRGRGGSTPEWLDIWARELAKKEVAALSLSELQRRSGRSVEHLARSCRRFFGVVPTEIIARARVGHAQVLLRDGEIKAADAALEVGFQNIGYFYRVFRRITGLTPRAWAKADEGVATVPR